MSSRLFRRKFATLAGLLAAVAVMVTLVSFSVTLYRLFCQATGALGTTQRVAADTAALSTREITVRFFTSTAPDLPWRFAPVQDRVRVKLGQDTLVFFEAENRSDEPIVGHATFNVTPGKAGKYFNKIQCFCFTEEKLEPHQKVEMPVDFYVDPKMAANANTRDVTEIDLSYEFFRSRRPQGAADLARFDQGPPDVADGEKIFAANCSACHALDHAKYGPPLRGVVGRHAARAPDYPYSSALAASDITWTPAALNQWLSGPQRMVPGTRMPAGLPDPLSRRDVIAWLQSAAPRQQASNP